MNIYRNIDRNSIQFDFVKHTSAKEAYDKEIEELGGKIYIAPSYRFYNHISYTNWWKIFLEEHPEYEIIHGHYFTISAVYFSVAQRIGRRTIAHAHSTRNEDQYRALRDCFTRQIKHHCDKALACSRPAGDWLFGAGNYQVLRNAIDVDKYRFDINNRKSIRKEFGINEELVIGTIGRFSPPKNPFGILSIMKELHDIIPKAKLLWVGTGEMISETQKLAEKKGLKESIIFTGSRSDVPALLSAMDVFILPSFFEGLPVSVIEAQAAGLKCFISDTVTKEVDINNRCCFLPIDKPFMWAEEIKNGKLDRVDISQSLKDEGYDIRSVAEQLQEMYLLEYNKKLKDK